MGPRKCVPFVVSSVRTRSIADLIRLGRRLKLQHIRLRRYCEQIQVTTCEERCAQVENVEASGHSESSGHGRGRCLVAFSRMCAEIDIDRYLHLRGNRAGDTFELECAPKELEPGNHKVGSIYSGCKLRSL